MIMGKTIDLFTCGPFSHWVFKIIKQVESLDIVVKKKDEFSRGKSFLFYLANLMWVTQLKFYEMRKHNLMEVNYNDCTSACLYCYYSNQLMS